MEEVQHQVIGKVDTLKIILSFHKEGIYINYFWKNFFSVHEAAHGYNEAVEDYNRAQHNSSSSPSRGYSDHANHATSPGLF